MINNIFFSILICVCFFLTPRTSKCQEVSLKKIDDVMELISKSQDSLLIINFWATWCKPCVKELPCFYEVEQRLSSKGVRVLLVSLDFKRQLETVLKPFMIKRGKGPEAWLLDEPDYDLWINKIDRSWSGAIPATLFIRNSEELQMFHEGEFTCESLNDTIQKILNK